MSEYTEQMYKEGGHNDLSVDEHLPEFPAPQGPDPMALIDEAAANQWREEGSHQAPNTGAVRRARKRMPLNFNK